MLADLAHEIVAGLVTYPGLAPPELGTVITRENSAARLGTAPQEDARLIALPAPVRGVASFPVCAVAVWDQ